MRKMCFVQCLCVSQSHSCVWASSPQMRPNHKISWRTLHLPVAMLLFEVSVLAILLLIIPQRSILSSSFPLSILFFSSLFFSPPVLFSWGCQGTQVSFLRYPAVPGWVWVRFITEKLLLSRPVTAQGELNKAWGRQFGGHICALAALPPVPLPACLPAWQASVLSR